MTVKTSPVKTKKTKRKDKTLIFRKLKEKQGVKSKGKSKKQHTQSVNIKTEENAFESNQIDPVPHKEQNEDIAAKKEHRVRQAPVELSKTPSFSPLRDFSHTAKSVTFDNRPSHREEYKHSHHEISPYRKPYFEKYSPAKHYERPPLPMRSAYNPVSRIAPYAKREDFKYR